VSIPIIVWGSQLVIKLMDRFPLVITVGGMLLGWIAGTMAVTDPAVIGYMPSETNPKGVVEVLDAVRYGAGVAGAVLVFLLGQMVLRRRAAKAA
jgi:predicted tellurium resistance membrane protein TerC